MKPQQQPQQPSQPQNSTSTEFAQPNWDNTPSTKEIVIMDEIKAMNERFDAMAEFLAKMDKKLSELIELAKG